MSSKKIKPRSICKLLENKFNFKPGSLLIKKALIKENKFNISGEGWISSGVLSSDLDSVDLALIYTGTDPRTQFYASDYFQPKLEKAIYCISQSTIQNNNSKYFNLAFTTQALYEFSLEKCLSLGAHQKLGNNFENENKKNLIKISNILINNNIDSELDMNGLCGYKILKSQITPENLIRIFHKEGISYSKELASGLNNLKSECKWDEEGDFVSNNKKSLKEKMNKLD